MAFKYLFYSIKTITLFNNKISFGDSVSAYWHGNRLDATRRNNWAILHKAWNRKKSVVFIIGSVLWLERRYYFIFIRFVRSLMTMNRFVFNEKEKFI
jgi:hypothetical protein